MRRSQLTHSRVTGAIHRSRTSCICLFSPLRRPQTPSASPSCGCVPESMSPERRAGRPRVGRRVLTSQVPSSSKTPRSPDVAHDCTLIRSVLVAVEAGAQRCCSTTPRCVSPGRSRNKHGRLMFARSAVSRSAEGALRVHSTRRDRLPHAEAMYAALAAFSDTRD